MPDNPITFTEIMEIANNVKNLGDSHVQLCCKQGDAAAAAQTGTGGSEKTTPQQLANDFATQLKAFAKQLRK